LLQVAQQFGPVQALFLADDTGLFHLLELLGACLDLLFLGTDPGEAPFDFRLAGGSCVAFALCLAGAGAGPPPGGDGQGDQDDGQQRDPPGPFQVAGFQFHDVNFRVI